MWEESAQKPKFPRLAHDLKTDVLIIGGGIAGILCAYMLQQAGVEYTLVEAREICSGITKNTTAKITFQHGLIYSRLVREFGAETARLYLEANEQAFDRLCSLCMQVACDFEYKDNYVYSVDNAEKIADELAALKTIGYQAETVKRLPLPFAVAGAVCFKKQAQFSPLKLLYAVAKELHIFENTPVKELVGKTAVIENGRITAKAPGETVITVSVEGTDLAKTCKVTVAPRLYTVTWVIDGVSQITEVAEGAALTPPAVHDRPGYNFAGWSPALPDVMPSADVTFTAVFEPVIRVSVVPAGASDEQVGQVIYHKVPWYKTWTSQTVDLTVASDDDSQIARVEWVYANWSVDEPEATIENAYSRTATIRPTWGIGARSCWVQAVVTDVYGNKIYSEPVKVRFYNWDWQK